MLKWQKLQFKTDSCDKKSNFFEDSKAYLLTVKRPLHGLTIHNKTEKGGLFIY